MINSEQNLSDRQTRAITALLSSKSISNGTALAGISRSTFYQWMQEPAFRKELEKQRKAAIDLSLHELKAATSESVQVLRRLLKAKNEGIRLRASTFIIEYVMKFIELEEIGKRLDTVEEALENERGNR